MSTTTDRSALASPEGVSELTEYNPPVDPDDTSADTANARRLADQLRSLAAMVEQHPELYDRLRYTFDGINVPTGPEVRAVLAAFARAGARSGAEVSKKFTDASQYAEAWAQVNVGFGPEVALHVYGARDQVCERVQVGTETKKVKDPEALAAVPEVEQEVPVYQWRCSDPLLRDAS